MKITNDTTTYEVAELMVRRRTNSMDASCWVCSAANAW